MWIVPKYHFWNVNWIGVLIVIKESVETAWPIGIIQVWRGRAVLGKDRGMKAVGLPAGQGCLERDVL